MGLFFGRLWLAIRLAIPLGMSGDSDSEGERDGEKSGGEGKVVKLGTPKQWFTASKKLLRILGVFFVR